jgi:hypothetical protein
MFGPIPPLHVNAFEAEHFWGRRDLPDLTAALGRDGVESTGGEVRAIERRGDQATILLADTVMQMLDSDCRDTNKVDRIERDGRVVYQQVCNKARARTVREKNAPITVPYEEARSLRPGEYVVAWVGRDRRGLVLRASKNQHDVQIRGIRLVAPEPSRVIGNGN